MKTIDRLVLILGVSLLVCGCNKSTVPTEGLTPAKKITPQPSKDKQESPKFVGLCVVEKEVGYSTKTLLYGLRDDGFVYELDLSAGASLAGSSMVDGKKQHYVKHFSKLVGKMEP